MSKERVQYLHEKIADLLEESELVHKLIKQAETREELEEFWSVVDDSVVDYTIRLNKAKEQLSPEQKSSKKTSILQLYRNWKQKGSTKRPAQKKMDDSASVTMNSMSLPASTECSLSQESQQSQPQNEEKPKKEEKPKGKKVEKAKATARPKATKTEKEKPEK